MVIPTILYNEDWTTRWANIDTVETNVNRISLVQTDRRKRKADEKNSRTVKHTNCFGTSISKYCNTYKISTTKCWQLTTTWDTDTFPFRMFCKKKYGSAVVVVLSFAARARDHELDRTSVRCQHVLLLPARVGNCFHNQSASVHAMSARCRHCSTSNVMQYCAVMSNNIGYT